MPNLFDKDYKCKWAYKGFCDGIAGEDLGLKYGGEEYKAFYEKNNFFYRRQVIKEKIHENLS